jgi:hypothetical protein
MPPQNSCPVQRIQSYLAIRSFASIQVCGETMSLEQQARRMLTSNAKTEGGFEYAGEYYTAYHAFLSGTNPSMPSKTLLQPNDLNSDRLLKVNAGGGSKIHTGDGLITKAKRDRAELQNCYMPLLAADVAGTLQMSAEREYERSRKGAQRSAGTAPIFRRRYWCSKACRGWR